MKINNLFKSFFVGIAILGIAVVPAKAFTNQVQIQKLPSYVTVNSFKLSCSALTANLIDGNPATTTTVQFYVNKNGGGDVAFGPTIDLSLNACQIQVTGSEITEEASYVFTAKLDSGEASTTATIYDNSGPSPVSGYYKDGLSDGVRIHWINPNDSDFSRVIIYRGTSPDFSADSSHEITTQPSGAGSPMTYEDHSVAPVGQSYYYSIRALDKAGNSSALVGDGGSVVNTVPTPVPSGEKVTIFPKEEGSVLGSEATPSPTPESLSITEKINEYANDKTGVTKWILTHKKISLGIGLALVAVAYFIYRKSSKK